MKRFARTADDTIVEIFEAANKTALGGLYHPDFVGALIEVPASAQLGWVKSGSNWSEPPVTPPSKAELAAYAAQRRWEIEIGGMAFAGTTVATDGESQTKVLGARVAAAADPDFTTPWFGLDGVPVMLDAAAIVSLSNAMLAHVQGGFMVRQQVLAKIEAGEITDRAGVDAAFD